MGKETIFGGGRVTVFSVVAKVWLDCGADLCEFLAEMKVLRLTEIVLRLGFGGLWIYAGVLKVLDPGQFLIDVRSYQLLEDPWAAAAALTLPWMEIFCGLVVVFGAAFYRGALALLNGALLLFLVAILFSWYRGIDISCGCFGSGSDSSYPWLVIRDIALLAVGGFLTWRARSAFRRGELEEDSGLEAVIVGDGVGAADGGGKA